MPGHDPRRPERVQRYQPGKQTDVGSPAEHVNALGMVCSLLGLLMRLKWAAWIGVHCSLVYLANSRAADDKKQMLSLFMLATSSLVMVYMQNPAPMSLGFG